MRLKQRIARHMLAAVLAAASLAWVAAPAAAATLLVQPTRVLAEAVAAAAPGDVLRLAAGVHRGPLRIDRPLTLAGEPGAVVEGAGGVITIVAPDVVVRGLIIRNSGISLEKMDAGVFVEQTAARALVEANRL